MRTPVILVGVDGSAESRAALRWAMEEAAHRGARVEAMLAYHQEPVIVPAVPMGLNPYGEMPQRHPARELHEAVQGAFRGQRRARLRRDQKTDDQPAHVRSPPGTPLLPRPAADPAEKMNGT